MHRSPQPLLLTLRELIERTFDLDTGVGDLSRHIIGDRGLVRIYGSDAPVRAVESLPRRAAPGIRPPVGPPPGDEPPAGGTLAARAVPASVPDAVGARTLIRETGGDLRVMLYYPDRLVRNLERHHPARTLSDRNVDDFAILIEELDHFLTIADRHRAGAQMSLLELELHANVTKELVLRLFLARAAGRERLDGEQQAWIRHHLFHKVEYREEDPGVQARYRDAAALAVRYLDSLHALPPAERPRELRRFHRRTHHEKLDAIGRL